jgi:hypothetical protein
MYHIFVNIYFLIYYDCFFIVCKKKILRIYVLGMLYHTFTFLKKQMIRVQVQYLCFFISDIFNILFSPCFLCPQLFPATGRPHSSTDGPASALFKTVPQQGGTAVCPAMANSSSS